MNRRQAAAYLGVSPATLDRLRARKHLPVGAEARVSRRRVRFDADKLRAWLDGGGIQGRRR